MTADERDRLTVRHLADQYVAGHLAGAMRIARINERKRWAWLWR